MCTHMHLPSLPAARPGAAPLSHTLVDGELRPQRLKLQLMTGQEALAAACVAQATPCWELLEECSVSSSSITDAVGELVAVSSTHAYLPDMRCIA